MDTLVNFQIESIYTIMLEITFSDFLIHNEKIHSTQKL